MDHPHQAVGLMAVAMATLPGQLREIGLASKQGAGLRRGIVLQERGNIELSRTRNGPKHRLKGGLSWLICRAKADLLKATMGCQGGVQPTISDIFTKGLIGKT